MPLGYRNELRSKLAGCELYTGAPLQQHLLEIAADELHMPSDPYVRQLAAPSVVVGR